VRRKLEAMLQAVQKGVLCNPRASVEETLVLCHSVINDGVSRDERAAEASADPSLKEMTLGAAPRGEKELGNRVWERGWYLVRLPEPGSDPTVTMEKGLNAGDRYKRAKYGDDDEDDDAPERGGAKTTTTTTLAALARSDEDVPPNFDLLVVFALGLLRALLRKMSGACRVFIFLLAFLSLSLSLCLSLRVLPARSLIFSRGRGGMIVTKSNADVQ
jgi:U3 small nucleolar RNA-associated protein 20